MSYVIDSTKPVLRPSRATWALLADLRVVGGCCGTDHEHIAAICAELG